MWGHPAFRDPARALSLGLVARGMHYTGMSRLALAALRAAHGSRYVRVVNYHGTPARDAESFRRQLDFYRRHFVPVRRNDLDELLVDRRWPHERPGLLISLDDGLRNNFDVAAPLLEEYGFTGWFFVPTEFVSLDPGRQAGFAGSHRINAADNGYADGRIALNWEEVRALDRRHVVGCHSRHHRRLGSSLTAAELEDEIVHSREALERELGHPVPYFCWVGGEEASYSTAAAREIRRAGYRYAFMTLCAPLTRDTPPLQIQRTNVEAAWPLSIVSFQLSGLLDLLYSARRRRVTRLTSASQSGDAGVETRRA
jgi:peptidoglycan/xylan/chitin deacetylase (PgdA/CDA1 family)